MIWDQHVFRKGLGARRLWRDLYTNQSPSILYITGRGFDPRAVVNIKEYVYHTKKYATSLSRCKLLAVGFTNYELSSEMQNATNEAMESITKVFSEIGSIEEVLFGKQSEDEDIGTSEHIRNGVNKIINELDNYSDIVFDVSSIPRVVYMGILSGILHRMHKSKGSDNDIWKTVNFQVLVGHDPMLDGKISSEDPNGLISVPGFSAPLHKQTDTNKPLVWFPILGEGRTGQLLYVKDQLPAKSEICPVLPHPSRNPRRADDIILEYREPLILSTELPVTNIVYAHESNPFECYRQLYKSMDRYCASLHLLGGTRIAVTPLSSKLITVGALLACFDIKMKYKDHEHGVAIAYAEPRKYTVNLKDLSTKNSEICTLLLTGISYSF